MANEVVSANLASNGGLVAEILAALVHEQIYDPTDLRAVCTRIPWTAGGSTTMAVTSLPAPAAYTAVTETNAAANSAYTTSEFTLTCARYARQYEITDLVPMAGSVVDLEVLAGNLVNGMSITISNLIAALFTSITDSAGTTQVDLSVDDLYDAQFSLNDNAAQGPYSAVLAPVQMNDFRSSLRGETGAQSFNPASVEQLATKGPGFQGSWNGINFWQSDQVATSGGDRLGCMFADGCFAYSEAPVSLLQGHIPADRVLLNAGELLVELIRAASLGETAALAHYYPAVAIAENARGCEIITDA
tara:strand:- start:13294 stop:14202 length:909 start_codon:yes stop_codon:yes gene_type:complete